MTIEIVDFPIRNGGSFHSYVNVYQRVSSWRHLCHFRKLTPSTGAGRTPWRWRRCCEAVRASSSCSSWRCYKMRPSLRALGWGMGKGAGVGKVWVLGENPLDFGRLWDVCLFSFQGCFELQMCFRKQFFLPDSKSLVGSCWVVVHPKSQIYPLMFVSKTAAGMSSNPTSAQRSEEKNICWCCAIIARCRRCHDGYESCLKWWLNGWLNRVLIGIYGCTSNNSCQAATRADLI